MSSYLNIYLKQEGTNPILFTYYTRSSEVYQAFYENLNIPFISTEKEEYKELNSNAMADVLDDFNRTLEKATDTLKVNYKILKEGGFNDSIWEEIQHGESYVKELKAIKKELSFIQEVVNLCYSDMSSFDKVLMNIN